MHIRAKQNSVHRQPPGSLETPPPKRLRRCRRCFCETNCAVNGCPQRAHFGEPFDLNRPVWVVDEKDGLGPAAINKGVEVVLWLIAGLAIRNGRWLAGNGFAFSVATHVDYAPCVETKKNSLPP